jgi:hypothetical protein
MAKAPPSGRCVHCLTYFNELTWDHVFPESWYPETTSEKHEKWKIPSCDGCNKQYGKIEEELLLKLGLCLDPTDANSKGIVQKVLRALNPEYGKNGRDSKMRFDKKMKILNSAFWGENIPTEGRYPKFDRPHGTDIEEMAVLIQAEHFRKLAEKIVRGITYLELNRFIEKPYSIDFSVLPENGAHDIQASLDRFGSVAEIQPGIKIKKAFASDSLSSLFYIEIWGRLSMYAFVTNK